jgi:hypothetical protein
MSIISWTSPSASERDLAGLEGDAVPWPVGHHVVGEVGQLPVGELLFGGGNVFRPQRAGDVTTVRPGAGGRLLVDPGQQPVVQRAALAGEGDAARLDLAEPHPQRPACHAAVGGAHGPGLGEGTEGRLAQQQVGAFPVRRALDGVDHFDAAVGHAPVQLVDVQDARGEVVDVGAADAADVRGDGGDPLQGFVPALVDRLGRQLEGPHGQLEEAFGFRFGQFAPGFGPVGEGEQLRGEQLAGGEEGFQAGAQVVVEEPRVGGREHGGEDPERVARQLLAVGGAEGGGDDGHRAGGGLAQIVEAGRVHAERPEDACDLAHLPWRADADRAVALRGDPADGSEPLGVGAPGAQHVVVHLAGDVHEGGVGGDLPPVHVREPGGERGAQLPLADRPAVPVHRVVLFIGWSCSSRGLPFGGRFTPHGLRAAPVPRS